LLDLVASGELAPVQSAAIGYLPSALLDYTGASAAEVIHRWCRNEPIVSGIFDLALGRIATVLIPRFDSQLYDDPADLNAALGDALRVARRLGAEAVSPTGLLSSATDYGRSLVQAV